MNSSLLAALPLLLVTSPTFAQKLGLLLNSLKVLSLAFLPITGEVKNFGERQRAAAESRSPLAEGKID